MTVKSWLYKIWRYLLGVLRGQQRAQGLLELTLALPVLILIFAGMVEVGAALHSYLIVTDATREGARFGSKGTFHDATIVATTLNAAMDLGNNIAITGPDGEITVNPEVATIIVTHLAPEQLPNGTYIYTIEKQYVAGGTDRPSQLSDEVLQDMSSFVTAYGAEHGVSVVPAQAIVVEMYYEHPQMLKVFSVGRLIPDPIRLYARTMMRIGSATRVEQCAAFPIAVHISSLEGKAPGETIGDIFNGASPGNFGWLRWPKEQSAGSEPYLVEALQDPTLSLTDYDNAVDPNDHSLNVGDWVWGNTGLTNSANVREALDALVGREILVVVWDEATGQGINAKYRVAGFAKIRITDYHLPGQDRITATFVGWNDRCQ